MAISISEDSELERARGEIYKFFAAMLLRRPSPEVLRNVLSEMAIFGLESLFPGHATVVKFGELVSDYRRGVWLDEDFLLDYESMFRVPGEFYIHPYESVYREHTVYSAGELHREMVLGIPAHEAAMLYQEEGLGPKEGFAEFPDHLGVELEFMAFLCRQRANAFEKNNLERASLYRSKQKDFLTGHLLPWSLNCLDEIERNASTPLYRCLACLLKFFLEGQEKLLARLI